MNDRQRKKLRKLLGKECRFTGTKLTQDDKNFLILDVKYENKVITDHVWCSITDNNKHINDGDFFSFKATVRSYIDSQNQRKYGLHKINNFIVNYIEDFNKDEFEKYKRLHYK